MSDEAGARPRMTVDECIRASTTLLQRMKPHLLDFMYEDSIHLVTYGEPAIALENLLSNLGEDFALVLPPPLKKELIEVAQNFGIHKDYWEWYAEQDNGS